MIVPRDEQLLSMYFETEVMQRRCDLALWSAIYEEALLRVARFKKHREERLRALAEYAHTLPSWEEDSQRYSRHIEFTTASATEFVLRLSVGEYRDQFVGVKFKLRENRGIYLHYVGELLDKGEPAPISFAARVSDVGRVAARYVTSAITTLTEYIVPIPSPSDYEEPDAPAVVAPTDDWHDELKQRTKARDAEQGRIRRAEEAQARGSNPPRNRRPSVLREHLSDLGVKKTGGGTG